MKRRFRVSFLLLAGILLLGFGLAGLLGAPGLMQYAFLPSAEQETGMPEKFEEALKNNADAFPRLTLHGQKPGVTLTADRERAAADRAGCGAGRRGDRDR